MSFHILLNVFRFIFTKLAYWEATLQKMFVLQLIPMSKNETPKMEPLWAT